MSINQDTITSLQEILDPILQRYGAKPGKHSDHQEWNAYRLLKLSLAVAWMDLIMRQAEHFEREKTLLEERRDQAERIANTDALTNLASRGALDRALPAANDDPDVMVVRFDANNFGMVNKYTKKGKLVYDEIGGDAVLKEMSRCIRTAGELHGTNRIFRRGGDEFVILCNKAVAGEIIAMAESLWDERLASNRALLGDDGEIYPVKPLRKLGVSLSGVAARTFKEGGIKLRERKAARKALSAQEGVVDITSKTHV